MIKFIKNLFSPVPLPPEEVVIDDALPKTVEGVVDDLISKMSEADRKFLMVKQPLGFDFGRSVRNHYGMWIPNSPVRKDAIKNFKVAHADDISGIVTDWMLAKVRNTPFDPSTAGQYYEEYWQREIQQSALEAGRLEGETY